MPFPKDTADMRVIRELLAKLKVYGLTDSEIANAIGLTNRNAIMSWRNSVNSTFPKNQVLLVLILDLVESISSIIGPDCQKEYIRSFFSHDHRRLGYKTPGQYLLQNGLTAREELMLLAKNYASETLDSRKVSGTSADAHYVTLHVRLDLEILHKYRLDKFDIAEIINKDRHRIDELMTGTGKRSQPTRLEAHQLRQAAAAAVALGQHHHLLAVKGLMAGSSSKYVDNWKATINSQQSIIEIIGSQVEGDSRSYERTAFILGHVLTKLTKKV